MPVDEREFFQEMTLRICSSLDVEQALARALEYLRRHVPADTIGLGFNELDAARIHVVSAVKRPKAAFIWVDDASEIRLSSALVRWIRSQEPDRPTAVISNTPDAFPVPMRDAFPGLLRDSAIFVRLDLHDDSVGALLVSARGLGRYQPRHAALLDMLRQPLAIAMMNARRYQQLHALYDQLAEDNRALSDDMQRSVGLEVVGADFGLRGVMEQVRRVAPTTSPVLVLGETGTGKEVIANAIHAGSARNGGPLISMQCGAIPDSLLDSELFGHEKGAFTGAGARKRGRFERADGGTLFLDEIGELSAEAQVKLLRVLQEKTLERVGGTETIAVDVRVVAATHRDLGAMVRAGTFREDLWYRLNVLPIRIPPLRLRQEDVPSLVQYFVKRKAREMNLVRTPRVRPSDLERLQRYDWPGNVRELQNVVERTLILSKGGTLEFPSLVGAALTEPPAEADRPFVPRTLDDVAAEHIGRVLEQVGWRISGPHGAAKILGVNASTLRFRMKKLGIERPRPSTNR
ncbi:MAG: sigma 54-interacting transcriptional regulator [Myxococcota bacterium]